MPFITLTDASANLPNFLQKGIKLLSCDYTIDDKAQVYDGDLDKFDFHKYYESLKSGAVAKTSLLNIQKFLTAFGEFVKNGMDVIYVSMSSGISGTYQAAKAAAQEIMEEFPERLIHIVDSKTCGLGMGLQALRSAELSDMGVETKEAAKILDEEVDRACSYFTVDDLNYLNRTGRVNAAVAKIVNVLNIKPILYGSSEGHIEACGKVRGRKNSINKLVEKYISKAVDPEKKTVFISHGDCLDDAKLLADKINEARKPANIVICPHEPFSGAHVGPGMLGLFFVGSER